MHCGREEAVGGDSVSKIRERLAGDTSEIYYWESSGEILDVPDVDLATSLITCICETRMDATLALDVRSEM